MIETASMAGFLAAHGIWSVSEGETLIPMFAHENPQGERFLDRVMADDIAEGARAAQRALEDNEHGATRAVMVVDAYVHKDSGPVDALLVEAVEYGLAPRTLTIAVLYRPAGHPDGFAVFSPEFQGFDGDDAEFEAVADAFFAGVESHHDAHEVWAAHYVRTV
ncbi:hypothetical protein [Saccharothrix variisporea]|uniref:Uncharacterized protein n=1 Tax=Saccharothrix variisporea TaxID=543527 RepID=A0A495X1F6_9PSEU|nr:hypothetical protein [Saccharothrix variisporea]RKT68001.1 hypothetical protein DFJ66_1182 [Saccharothrix variisporea]